MWTYIEQTKLYFNTWALPNPRFVAFWRHERWRNFVLAALSQINAFYCRLLSRQTFLHFCEIPILKTFDQSYPELKSECHPWYPCVASLQPFPSDWMRPNFHSLKPHHILKKYQSYHIISYHQEISILKLIVGEISNLQLIISSRNINLKIHFLEEYQIPHSSYPQEISILKNSLLEKYPISSSSYPQEISILKFIFGEISNIQHIISSRNINLETHCWRNIQSSAVIVRHCTPHINKYVSTVHMVPNYTSKAKVWSRHW